MGQWDQSEAMDRFTPIVTLLDIDLSWPKLTRDRGPLGPRFIVASSSNLDPEGPLVSDLTRGPYLDGGSVRAGPPNPPKPSAGGLIMLKMKKVTFSKNGGHLLKIG